VGTRQGRMAHPGLGQRRRRRPELHVQAPRRGADPERQARPHPHHHDSAGRLASLAEEQASKRAA